MALRAAELPEIADKRHDREHSRAFTNRNQAPEEEATNNCVSNDKRTSEF